MIVTFKDIVLSPEVQWSMRNPVGTLHSGRRRKSETFTSRLNTFAFCLHSKKEKQILSGVILIIYILLGRTGKRYNEFW